MSNILIFLAIFHFSLIILLKDNYRNILRHKLELKSIKSLQTPHPLGFNDNYHEYDFDVFFSLLDIHNPKSDLMVYVKIGILNA